jgi:hypothetical protein
MTSYAVCFILKSQLINTGCFPPIENYTFVNKCFSVKLYLSGGYNWEQNSSSDSSSFSSPLRAD